MKERLLGLDVPMKEVSLDLNLPSREPANAVWFEDMLASLGVSRGAGWPDRFGQSLRRWFAEHGHSPIKTLSLFAGGGGLDIGFHDAGFEIVQMVELEAKYVRTLERNSQPGKWLENSHPTCADIRKFVPDSQLKVDFIIGGPPCQTFSAAGRRAAGVAGTSDARGTLFQEYVRLLKALQPKGFLFENVYGIISAQKGEAWRQIQKAFRDAGYRIFYRILDAADYGVPQHRERLFIVGLKDGDYLFPCPTHGPDSPGKVPFYTALEAVAGADTSGAEAGIGGRYGHLLENIPPGLNYSFYTEEMGHPQPVFSWRSKFSDFLYKADPEMPVRTIKARGGQYTGPFSWENRRFTIAELKRLQTFPDEYEIVGNRSVCVEQIGNSVPPQLGRILALSILQQVMGVELPFSMHYLPPAKELGFRQRKRQLTERYAEKAREAIALLGTEASPAGGVFRGEAVRFLSLADFGWSEREVPNSVRVNLRYDLNEECWEIVASAGAGRLKSRLYKQSPPARAFEEVICQIGYETWPDENQYAIEVSPSLGREDWGLGTRKVKLCAKDLEKPVFAALWKAFEEKLVEVTGKADLVQLAGYYQYTPRIRGVMSFHPQLRVEPFWRVVQGVVSGIGVATQLRVPDLALLWGVNAEDVFYCLQVLRGMGYEVRNHNTNSQIRRGEYLVPYGFPTLTPRSVQLRKNLNRQDAIDAKRLPEG